MKNIIYILFLLLSLSGFPQTYDEIIYDKTAVVSVADSAIIDQYFDSVRIETNQDLVIYEINDYPNADSLPYEGWVYKDEIYSYGSENVVIVQSHNRSTTNHYDPHDVPALYKFMDLSTGCDDAKEWVSSDHWTTYSLGDLRTNDGKLWEVINVGFTYYEPSGANGHYGWEYVEDCP